MPTYEYRCKSCGHDLEVQQSFTDDALTTCPSCGEAALRKVFGNIAVTFKGSGFYKTDNRSGASKSSTSSSSESSSSSSSESSSSSSDSKSDTKSDSKKSETKSDSSSTTSAAATS
jgi:putative FmdB family regulatory protein